MNKPFNDRRSSQWRMKQGARRKYPRVKLGLDGFYHSDSRTMLARGGDLNLRGAFLATAVPDPVGTTAFVRLGLPGSPAMLRIPARVVWSNDRPELGATGMGLRFEGLLPWQIKRIASIVLHRGGADAIPQLSLDPLLQTRTGSET